MEGVESSLADTITPQSWKVETEINSLVHSFWWPLSSSPNEENTNLYNSSHKLGPYIQRVVLHHVEGHCAHDQHMLLVM